MDFPVLEIKTRLIYSISFSNLEATEVLALTCSRVVYRIPCRVEPSGIGLGLEILDQQKNTHVMAIIALIISIILAMYYVSIVEYTCSEFWYY